MEEKVNITIVGKYIGLKESYKSLIGSLDHAGYAHNVKVKINWLNAREIVKNTELLVTSNAILVPGGFGSDGIKGKIAAIKYARENNIPFFWYMFRYAAFYC